MRVYTQSLGLLMQFRVLISLDQVNHYRFGSTTNKRKQIKVKNGFEYGCSGGFYAYFFSSSDFDCQVQVDKLLI